MATAREASIHVTMKTSGFLSGLRQIKNQSLQEAKAMGRGFSRHLGAGLKGGLERSKQALKDLGGGLKENIKNAATFGGALGGAALVHNAMQLQGLYAQVAFEMERASGKAFSVADAQEAITKAADKTKRTHEEMATALRVMLDRGADPAFAVESMESVGHAINSTGQDAERVGRVISALSIKYGLSGKEGVKMLDDVIATASKGKITMEEYMEDFNEFGSIASAAGLKGESGLRTMLGMIAKMGPQVNGTTSEISSGMDILFERLRDMGIMERIFKESKSKMKFSREDFGAVDNAFDQMEYLAKAGPDAMKLFASEFTGREEKAAFEAFFGPYFQSLEKGLTEGKKKTEAHVEAMKDLRLGQLDLATPLGEQGKVAEHSARAQKTAAAKMRDAMNKLSEAMTKPEMLSAIDSLAENMPPLASAVAKALDFIANNPLAAVGIFAGAKVGLAFAQGALVKAGSSIGTSAAAAIKARAAAAGTWGTAGRALGVAAGAAIAFYIGKKAIDKMFEERSKEHGAAVGTEAAAFATAKSTDLNRKQSELQNVRAQINALKAKQGSFTGKVTNAANMTFGALSGALGLTEGYTDTRADSLAKLEAAERELQGSIENQRKSQDTAAGSAMQMAAATREATRAMRALAKSANNTNGTNGPVSPGHTGPGWAQQ